eukprot:CAMPEP_0178987772 /NCGR_PEP_ID=MMETSP0795-20121207/3453_1 /TAXON_ID=88552 /ORGANISM="Amoebophrya sp., Strain Ameob2" /LENGTH=2154 /DNA_ID=CAMNT_0020678997 /DNA_START=309 /DNA_END=6773 /DNA_ORIENTATION=-
MVGGITPGYAVGLGYIVLISVIWIAMGILEQWLFTGSGNFPHPVLVMVILNSYYTFYGLYFLIFPSELRKVLSGELWFLTFRISSETPILNVLGDHDEGQLPMVEDCEVSSLQPSSLGPRSRTRTRSRGSEYSSSETEEDDVLSASSSEEELDISEPVSGTISRGTTRTAGGESGKSGTRQSLVLPGSLARQRSANAAPGRAEAGDLATLQLNDSGPLVQLRNSRLPPRQNSVDMGAIQRAWTAQDGGAKKRTGAGNYTYGGLGYGGFGRMPGSMGTVGGAERGMAGFFPPGTSASDRNLRYLIAAKNRLATRKRMTQRHAETLVRTLAENLETYSPLAHNNALSQVFFNVMNAGGPRARGSLKSGNTTPGGLTATKLQRASRNSSLSGGRGPAYRPPGIFEAADEQQTVTESASPDLSFVIDSTESPSTSAFLAMTTSDENIGSAGGGTTPTGTGSTRTPGGWTWSSANGYKYNKNYNKSVPQTVSRESLFGLHRKQSPAKLNLPAAFGTPLLEEGPEEGAADAVANLEANSSSWLSYLAPVLPRQLSAALGVGTVPARGVTASASYSKKSNITTSAIPRLLSAPGIMGDVADTLTINSLLNASNSNTNTAPTFNLAMDPISMVMKRPPGVSANIRDPTWELTLDESDPSGTSYLLRIPLRLEHEKVESLREQLAEIQGEGAPAPADFSEEDQGSAVGVDAANEDGTSAGAAFENNPQKGLTNVNTLVASLDIHAALGFDDQSREAELLTNALRKPRGSASEQQQLIQRERSDGSFLLGPPPAIALPVIALIDITSAAGKKITTSRTATSEPASYSKFAYVWETFCRPLVIGLLFMGCIFLDMIALQLTSLSSSTLCGRMNNVTIYMASILFLGEASVPAKWIGVALCLSGVSLVVVLDAEEKPEGANAYPYAFYGDLAALIGVIFYTLYAITLKMYVKTTADTMWTLTLTGLFFTCLGLPWYFFCAPDLITGASDAALLNAFTEPYLIASFLFLGLVGGAGSNFLWVRSCQLVGPSVLAVGLNLGIPLSMLWDRFGRGFENAVAPPKLFSAFLVVCGFLLVIYVDTLQEADGETEMSCSEGNEVEVEGEDEGVGIGVGQDVGRSSFENVDVADRMGLSVSGDDRRRNLAAFDEDEEPDLPPLESLSEGVSRGDSAGGSPPAPSREKLETEVSRRRSPPAASADAGNEIPKFVFSENSQSSRMMNRRIANSPVVATSTSTTTSDAIAKQASEDVALALRQNRSPPSPLAPLRQPLLRTSFEVEDGPPAAEQNDMRRSQTSAVHDLFLDGGSRALKARKGRKNSKGSKRTQDESCFAFFSAALAPPSTEAIKQWLLTPTYVKPISLSALSCCKNSNSSSIADEGNNKPSDDQRETSPAAPGAAPIAQTVHNKKWKAFKNLFAQVAHNVGPNCAYCVMMLLPQTFDYALVGLMATPETRTYAVGGVALGTSMINVFGVAPGIGFNQALDTLISVAYGARKHTKIFHYMAQAQLLILCYTPFVFLITGVCVQRIFDTLAPSTDPRVAEQAVGFLHAQFITTPLFLWSDIVRKFFSNVRELQRIQRVQMVCICMHPVWVYGAIEFVCGRDRAAMGAGLGTSVTWTTYFLCYYTVFARWFGEFRAKANNGELSGASLSPRGTPRGGAGARGKKNKIKNKEVEGKEQQQATTPASIEVPEEEKVQQTSIFFLLDVTNKYIYSGKALASYGSLAIRSSANVLTEWVAREILTFAMSQVSAEAIAIHAAIDCTYAQLYMVPLGIASSTATLVGGSLGMRKPRQAARFTYISFLFGIAAWALMFGALFGFPPFAFGSNKELEASFLPSSPTPTGVTAAAAGSRSSPSPSTQQLDIVANNSTSASAFVGGSRAVISGATAILPKGALGVPGQRQGGQLHSAEVDHHKIDSASVVSPSATAFLHVGLWSKIADVFFPTPSDPDAHPRKADFTFFNRWLFHRMLMFCFGLTFWCDLTENILQGVFRACGRQQLAATIYVTQYYAFGLPIAFLFAFSDAGQGITECLWKGWLTVLYGSDPAHSWAGVYFEEGTGADDPFAASERHRRKTVVGLFALWFGFSCGVWSGFAAFVYYLRAKLDFRQEVKVAMRRLLWHSRASVVLSKPVVTANKRNSVQSVSTAAGDTPDVGVGRKAGELGGAEAEKEQ